MFIHYAATIINEINTYPRILLIDILANNKEPIHFYVVFNLNRDETRTNWKSRTTVDTNGVEIDPFKDCVAQAFSTRKYSGSTKMINRAKKNTNS